MASILYYGSDKRISEYLTEFFTSRREDVGEAHAITMIDSPDKLIEAMIAVAFDFIFVEQTLAAPNAVEWLLNFNTKYPRFSGPMILIGEEKNEVRLIKYLNSGWKDYILFPPDKALLIEKFGMYTTGKRSSDIRQVYSLSLSEPAHLAKLGQIEEVSEFDCAIRTLDQIPIDDLLIIHSDAFGADLKTQASCIGRCYQSEPHAEFKGHFLTKFYYVGISTDILKNIRNTLRKTYVSAKGK